MRKFATSVLIALLGWSMTTPVINAQSRGGRGNGSRTEYRNDRGNTRPGSGNSRPGNGNSRPGNGGSNRPSDNTGRPGQNRPGQGNQGNSGNRPGQGNQGNRPGQNNPGYNRPDYNRPGYTHPGQPGDNRPGYNRPGHNNPGPNRPGNNWGNVPSRPGHSVRPGGPNRPGNNWNNRPIRPGVPRPQFYQRPYRPGLAPARPFIRPLPPSHWRPVRRISLWTNILGVTVGMSFNSAIDYLLDRGYYIDGYQNNEVYLRNVNEFSFFWPEATMYYTNDTFCGSRFYYSSLANNMDRYREVFYYLSDLYGSPVSTSSNYNGTSATWWGEGNQYITLNYAPILTDSGTRFFTTLSIGI